MAAARAVVVFKAVAAVARERQRTAVKEGLILSVKESGERS
jgi:hypothetical protein